jgi:hypothetical protein
MAVGGVLVGANRPREGSLHRENGGIDAPGAGHRGASLVVDLPSPRSFPTGWHGSRIFWWNAISAAQASTVS